MSNTARIPTWKLERYRLGELPAAELNSLKQQIAASPESQAELDSLNQQDATFLQTHDPHTAARRMQALASARADVSTKQARGIWAWAGIPSGVLASLLLVFVGFHFAQVPSVMEDRSKGLENRIEIWQKTGDSAALLLDSAQLAAGDLIQIRVQPKAKCFAAVVSLDGRGQWTTHLPSSGTSAEYLEPGQKGFLPFSYQLDDAPRYEVFWLITSNTPFRVDSLMQSLDAVAASPMAPPVLPLEPRFTQTRLYLRK